MEIEVLKKSGDYVSIKGIDMRFLIEEIIYSLDTDEFGPSGEIYDIEFDLGRRIAIYENNGTIWFKECSFSGGEIKFEDIHSIKFNHCCIEKLKKSWENNYDYLIPTLDRILQSTDMEHFILIKF